MTRGARDAGGNAGNGSHWIRTTTRHRIYQRDGYRCVWCRADLYGRVCPARTLDHVLARSRGGSNRPHNLVTACVSCNASRGDRAAITYAYEVASEPAASRRVVSQRASVILNRMLDAVCADLPAPEVKK